MRARWYMCARQAAENKLELVIQIETKNMTKTTKKELSDHDKAIRLLEGGLVEIDGLVFSIDEAGSEDDPCYSCKLDSICSPNIIRICLEADLITRTSHKMILH